MEELRGLIQNLCDVDNEWKQYDTKLYQKGYRTSE